jgi:hypothetical protein
MEESKAYATGTENVAAPTYRPRQMADVPEDVDFLMEHLNDPNYDLKKGPPSLISEELQQKKIHMAYEQSEIDGESHYESDRYSTSRAESRNSTAIDFDE